MNDKKMQNIDAAIQHEEQELAESLKLFRSAVHHVAEREAAKLAPMPKKWNSFGQRLRLVPGWAFGWGLAAALCLSVLPFWMRSHRTASVASPAPVAQTHASPAAAVSDEVLLSQINDAVSQDVPDSLRPLAELDSWSSSTQSTNKQSEKNHAIQE